MDSTRELELKRGALYVQSVVTEYYQTHKIPVVWSQFQLQAMRKAKGSNKFSDLKSEDVLKYAIENGYAFCYISRRNAKCMFPPHITQDCPEFNAAMFAWDTREKAVPPILKRSIHQKRKSGAHAARAREKAREEKHLRHLALLEESVQALLIQVQTYKGWSETHLARKLNSGATSEDV